jgi:glutamyl-tRNA reductase
MHQQFKALSISYKTAPVEIREKISLGEEACKSLMVQIREILDVQELLILSTCNRTEVYYSAPEDKSTDIIKLICLQKSLFDTDAYLPYFERFNSHNEATTRLFEVCLGLHSQVVGDMQIANQAKQAYQWTADLNLAGPFLHRLMHATFFASKRVAQETSFRDGAASVSYAAVELLEELTEGMPRPNVLVVGLGEIGADVCRNLAEKRNFAVTLTNRTGAKAEALAAEHNLPVLPFDEVWQAMPRFDVVICSVAKHEPFITKAAVQKMNILSYKYFIDLSVPRSVEASVDELPGALVYNIDDIQAKASAALQRRLAAVPKVKEIIAQAVEEFSDWTRETAVSPTIHKLKNALEHIRQEEVARHLKGMSPSEAQKVDQITKAMMQKIIKLPVLQLKAACKRGEAETLIDVLNDLFNLEKQPDLTEANGKLKAETGK